MRALATLLLALALTGCKSVREGQDLPGADTLTRAERDSILGASKLPGHRAIQRAIDVSDSATTRTERIEQQEQQLDTLME